MTLARVIEALLFSAPKPLSIRELAAAIKGAGTEDEVSPNEFARVTEGEIVAALEQLRIEYVQEQRAFQIIEKAEGWQLVTDPAFASWVRQLFPLPKPARLTAPGLETLAIIAYRQPITRADVEAVRTTQFFLDHFGLRSLDELPNVEELRTRHLPVAGPPSQPAVPAATANSG